MLLRQNATGRIESPANKDGRNFIPASLLMGEKEDPTGRAGSHTCVPTGIKYPVYSQQFSRILAQLNDWS